MRFCEQCGAANEMGSTVCYACGAELAPAAPVKSRGSHSLRIPKAALAIGGAILAVALVVGGIIWAVSGKKTNVDSALERTMDQLTDEDSDSLFRRFLSQANDRLAQGEYTLCGEFTANGRTWSLEMDYDRPDSQLQGRVDLNGFNLEYSAKKDVIQLRFPGKYEVYGFRTSQINRLTEKINDMMRLPLIGNLLPDPLPTDLKLNLFEKKDLKDLLRDVAGEEYDAFRKNLKTEDWNDETITRAGKQEPCSVYKVSWKSEDLTSLLGALGSGGVLPDISGLVNALLPEVDPYAFCYVNQDGYFVGARFTMAAEKYFFLLEGEENLWETFSITVDTASQDTRIYRGGLTKTGQISELRLRDRNGEDRLRLVLDEESGDFSLFTASLGEALTGRIRSQEGEASLSLAWYLPDASRQEINVTITHLRQQPKQLGEKYTDLLSGTWQILENILADWLTQGLTNGK